MAFADGTADFRSDTVTRPTPAMRDAMARAPVGDDVYGEDPTVNRLEEACAAALGKQSALFVPSGTMGNQLAIMLQTRPGEEVLCDEEAHLRSIERGAASALSGVAFRTVDADGGAITPGDVDAAMSAAGTFLPRIGLLTWENTHGGRGGRVVPIEIMEETSAAARRHRLSQHLDGARLWNATAASGIDAARYSAAVDTVAFCFSKGLGAPVGSILCGDSDAIGEARYLRKRLGGGMRQVGVIAAAAQVAFDDRARLVEDHQLASELAEQLAERFPGSVDPADVETNIVNVDASVLPPIEALMERCSARGVVVSAPRLGVLRLVTHRDVDGNDVERLVAAFGFE